MSDTLFELRPGGTIKVSEKVLFSSEMFRRQVKASQNLAKALLKKQKEGTRNE
jgi:hypothetical protein